MNETTRTESETVASEPRRRFLGWLTRGFLSLWAVGAAWVVGSFLKAPSSERSLTERVIKIQTPLAEFPVGHGELVRHGRDPVWLMRPGEEDLVALSGVCTHLHCVLQWDGEQQKLLCPCHDGIFDVNGNVVAGPPPRPLTRHRVETRLGRIYIHL